MLFFITASCTVVLLKMHFVQHDKEIRTAKLQIKGVVPSIS